MHCYLVEVFWGYIEPFNSFVDTYIMHTELSAEDAENSTKQYMEKRLASRYVTLADKTYFAEVGQITVTEVPMDKTYSLGTRDR